MTAHMCEVLLRVIDKSDPDPKIDSKCLKAGDVVVIREDDWNWSEMEKTAPFWRIVRIVGMSVEEATLEFLAPENGSDANNPYLRRRKSFIDIDSLSQSNKNAIAAERNNNVLQIPAGLIRSAKAV